MKRVHKVLVSIAAFAALGLSINDAAFAEPFGMGGPEACPHEQGMMGHGGPGGPGAKDGKGQADFAAIAAKRLDKFRSELKITASQENAWQAFAGKAKQQVEGMQAMHDKMHPASAKTADAANVSAPERMDKGIEFMKQRLASMEAMNAALKDLYAVLTQEQKAIADKHFTHQQEQRGKRMMRRGG